MGHIQSDKKKIVHFNCFWRDSLSAPIVSYQSLCKSLFSYTKYLDATLIC
jgi:hypothetical protein